MALKQSREKRPRAVTAQGVEAPARITLIDYGAKRFTEKTVKSVEEVFKFKETDTVSWINVQGIHDAAAIRKIGGNFGLHPLLLEDITNTAQRPKLEEFDDYAFIVLKMLYFDEEKNDVRVEQVSLVLAPKFVLSFEEANRDVFNEVRERIRTAKGNIRSHGNDYLVYELMDAIVDNYFVILERMGERIESLEDELVANPNPRTVRVLHKLKREMIFLRRSVWPLREVVNSVERLNPPLVKASTKVYFRDLYDHTVQAIEAVETFRDILSGMLEIYLSSISNRLNETMKFLTIIGTLFIPLTFITGVYGMNFDFMPELRHPYGYYSVLLFMGVIAAAMLSYFRKKKWI